ncbi:MAG: sigma-70 family RNA polymerase sigma factor [Clostridia bacterium]|nr:sigma-70 family RNA polymerase sigma factor [Clostridia bacterium]
MDIASVFQTIYDRTYRQTAAQIIARCRQSADAGDINQEVYLEFYRILQRKGANYIKSPNALLQRLIRQKLARYYRALGHRREVQETPQEDGTVIAQADIDALSVEEIAVEREVLEWTDRYLAAKGEPVRKIFHLYYRLNLSVPQIARLLGRSESDVKNRLYRTLNEIRTYWKGEDT